ncbi:transglycosylase domain-containing protein [Phytomonospora endophytica]|uniref:Membrane peptidoglycan carboxypeptidase n=1 Tax=Phytomonospora endophytica TaxID=714109 RepID=A0A841G1G7_9ACTN|nr:transglycosylase domain-containing protein [Phytomonospora endophytica]MBB6038509.1 membrane peptidoglycan carboxypeptidase [Phytomonospora endophytica]GIG64439.1 penicillin-binding protein [Phytomonospora endophytica]
MADHSNRGSSRAGGYDDYDYGDRRYGDGPVSGGPSGGQAPVWGDGYDYSDPARNHAEPASGRASVPGMMSAPAHDDYDYEPNTVTGRASVGKREAKGRATVTGPRSKPTDEELAARKKKLKKKKRIRRWAIFGCVVAMLGGVSVFGVATFWAGVPLPNELELTASSSVTYAGGESMGGIGKEFRVNVPFDQIPAHVKWAVIAAEDTSFYENPGVDFKGVMRAFWNNVTGGDTQGASTITQQYAGIAANMRDEATYGRKAREAVIAMKLDDEYEKDQILGFYLDVVYMGRSAYGIGAASLAFYGKPVTELNVAQAALLAAQIKSPNGYYDPEHPEGVGSEGDVTGRYEYVLKSMLDLGAINATDYSEALAKLPKVEEKTSNPADYGFNKPTGFVSHRYVIEELERRYGITEEQLYGNGNLEEGVANTIEDAGGYTITTTIDKKLQDAAIKAASRGKKGEVMPDTPKNLLAALVAVDPKTGAVRAYYGGTENGTGIDKAGRPPVIRDTDSDGDAHPMGSSFKIFTLATALMNGVSVDSKWDGSSPREFPGRMKDDPAGAVVNSGDSSSACARCTLGQEIIDSLNTPMFAIAEKYTPEAIVKQAAAMGVTGLEDSKGNWHEFDENFNFEESREWFDREVSFGQYPTTVFSMAEGAATIAANGTHRESHFIQEVTKNGEKVEPISELSENTAIGLGEAADMSSVLTQIGPSEGGLDGGRPAGSKTGTWERDCPEDGSLEGCVPGQNSNTSYLGYTPQLATAVWVGDKKNDNGKVTDNNDNELYGSMTAGSVWRNFMNKAMEGKEFEAFPPKAGTGDINAGDAKPDDKKDDKNCIPIIDPNCKPNDGHGPNGTDGADGNNGTDGEDRVGVYGAGGGTGSAPFASDGVGQSGQSAYGDYGMSVLPYATFQRQYSISNT